MVINIQIQPEWFNSSKAKDPQKILVDGEQSLRYIFIVILYRPVGLKELELIAAAGYTAFPPRLPEQPIFYPVLNFVYAEQIARDWNATTPPFAGFVTRFEVEQAYVEKYEVHTVGGKIHQELWVPADELEEFNRHIVGKIEVVASYYGEQYAGDDNL